MGAYKIDTPIGTMGSVTNFLYYMGLSSGL